MSDTSKQILAAVAAVKGYLRDVARAIAGRTQADRQRVYSAAFEQGWFDARMDVLTGRVECPCRGEVYPEARR